MTNYVYKIIFNKRIEDNTPPFYYIGCKSNANFINGQILDSRNKPYYGSSSWTNYSELVKNGDCSVEILGEFDIYTDALNYEREIQIELNVVENYRYFNKSISMSNNFTDPNFATYKHVETGKCERLEKNCEAVLNGTYVGVSLGTKMTPEQLIRHSEACAGEKNGFYGKTHTEETRKIIGEKTKAWFKENPKTEEQKQYWIENVAKKPKSESHRKKIGAAHKGFRMLKNVETGETIRIRCEDSINYDLSIWKNPTSLKQKKCQCVHCGMISGCGNILRWHNDNCKHKPKED